MSHEVLQTLRLAAEANCNRRITIAAKDLLVVFDEIDRLSAFLAANPELKPPVETAKTEADTETTGAADKTTGAADTKKASRKKAAPKTDKEKAPRKSRKKKADDPAPPADELIEEPTKLEDVDAPDETPAE